MGRPKLINLVVHLPRRGELRCYSGFYAADWVSVDRTPSSMDWYYWMVWADDQFPQRYMLMTTKKRPKARDLLIRYFDFTTYQSFARAINGSFSINWPHHLNGILEGTPEKGFVLTRMFVEHVRKPANWTVGPGVIDEFPFLKGSMNVR